MKPNDKPVKTDDEQFEQPELTLVIGGEKFPKPGLETAFVDYSDAMDVDDSPDESDDDDKKYAALRICSCNRVYVSLPRRAIERRTGIVEYFRTSLGEVKTRESSSSGSGRSGCRCAPVS